MERLENPLKVLEGELRATGENSAQVPRVQAGFLAEPIARSEPLLEPFFPFSPAASQEATAVTVDASDRPVTAGWATIGQTIQFAVARHLGSGAVDGSFGSGGTVLVDFPGSSAAIVAGVAVDSQGRIVVARLTGAGTLDTSFDGDGTVLTDWATGSHEAVLALAFDGWGRIIAVGGVEQASP